MTEMAVDSTRVFEQQKSLSAGRHRYGVLARLLFATMDLFYGTRRTFEKFKVLEVVARVPYQAWEHVGYVAMTHKYRSPGFARRIFDFVVESRQQQDNEQWHLFIIEELIVKRNIPQGVVRFVIIPQLLAFFYYHVSWLLYVIDPGLSYRLNADFEDHAEHEYMEFVSENPSFEETPWESEFEHDYGKHATLAELLRQIGLDERHHKEESLARLEAPRFS